jgi:hypothetical protein
MLLIKHVNNNKLLTPNHKLRGSMIAEIRRDDNENRKVRMS